MQLKPRKLQGLKPVALAASLLMGAQPAMTATITWVGPNASFWDLLANWDAGLPGSLDDVALGAFETTFRSGTVGVRSFNGSGLLNLTGGQLSVSNNSFIGQLTLSGGTLAGAGAVSVSGAANWTAGTMTGAGRTQANGVLTLSGAGLKDISNGRTLATAGTTTWTNTASGGGRIRTGGGITIDNSGAWLDNQAFDGSISQDFGGAPSNFNNRGTYTKSGATTTSIGIAFNNTSSGAGTGVVNVNAGMLALNGGGSSNGSFSAVAGTTLAFGGGHALLASSSVNTAGMVEFVSGTNTVAGSFNVGTSTEFSGGTTTFSGTVSGVGSSIVASGGAGVFNNAQAVSVSALQVSGGTLTFNNTGGASSSTFSLANGLLSGTSNVTVSGASTWTAGTMTGAGRTQANGALTLSGAGLKDISNGRTLATAGTTTWTNTASGGGRIRTGGGIAIDNSGAWLDKQAFDGSISQDFGGAASNFNNRGTYTKSGATTTSIGIAFNNTSSGAGTGVVNVNAGTLALNAGGSSNGSFTGLAGTALGLGGGHALQAASSVNTAGTVEFTSGTNTVAGSFNAGTSTEFSGGTTTFSGTVTGVGSSIVASGGTGLFNNTQAFAVSALQVSGGALTFNNTGGASSTTLNLANGFLSGTSNVTVSGASTWTAGTMTGTGRTQANGALTLSGVGLKDISNGRVLATAGTTTWTNTASSGGRIRTGGGITIDNSGAWLDNQAFDGSISQDFGGAASNFNNRGTYTKSGATTTSIGIAFNNTSSGAGTGVVNVNAGTLALNAGGSSNGSFTGLAGTTLGLGGGHALQTASSVNTAGTVEFTSGTNTVNGSFNAGTSTEFSGGTTTFSGTVTGVGSSIVASGGTGVFNNTQAFAVSALQLSSGGLTFNNTGGVTTTTLGVTGGTLGGTSTVTVSGATTWTSGTMTGSGRTQADGTLVISGAGLKDLTGGRNLVADDTTWTNTAAGNGRIRTGGSALITNTGTWADQQAFDSAISPDFGGSARFDNQGVYTKSGVGTTAMGIAFDNTSTGAGTGVVNVNAGTLALNAGGSSNGSFQGTGRLDFGGGVYSLLAGSSVTNTNVQFSGGTTNVGGSYNASGTTTVNGGTANFTGTVAGSGGSLIISSGTANFNNLAGVSVATLTLSGGTLGGTQDLAVSGATTWINGTMAGTGRTLANGTLAISGAALKDLTGGRRLVAGDTTWTNTANGNGRIRTGGAALITNTGTWADQQAFDSSISPDFGGSAHFANQGVYNKNGAGTTTISIAFDNTTTGAGTGVVNVNAGTLSLDGGGTSNGSFQGTGRLVFGGGVHNLQAASSVANPNVQFSGGTTNVGGSYNVAGTTTVNGGTANFTGTVANSGGNLVVSSGAANFSNLAGVTVSALSLSGGTVGGTQALTVSGNTSWTSGTMTGTGSTTLQGALSLAGAGLKDLTGGRVLNAEGTTTWTNTAASNGRIRTGGGAVINNSGSWLDQQAFNGQISPDFGGNSTFNNIGSYTKSGAAITDMSVAFANGNTTPGTGVVNLNAGTLRFSAGGNSLGTFNVADGTTLDFNAGTYTLGGTLASSTDGRVLVSGSTVNTVGAKSFAGLLELSSGTFNVNADASAARYLQSAGTLGGTGNLAISGSTVWTAGTMTGPGSTTSSGTLALSGAGLKDLTAGRKLNTAGTTTWTNTANSNGRIRTGSAVAINNSGSWLDQQAFNGSISPDFGGTASFNNSGSYAKTGAGTTDISIAFSNPGRLSVSAGQLNLTGGLSNFAGNTLTGGTFEVIGNSTLRFTGANIVTNAATLLLDGAGSALLNATNNANALANFTNNAAAGSFTIRNGRNFTSAGAFSNAGIVQVGTGSTFTGGANVGNLAGAQLQMAGGSFAGPALVNAGSVNGFGNVNTLVQSSGTVAANGGTLAANAGIQGASGAVTVASGATLDLSASTVASSTGTLLNQGTLNLGAQALQVHADYDNSGFGSGNSFAARSGVLGGGAIVGVNAALALTGDVSSPAANQYVIDFGAVREGTTVIRSFQVANSGTGASVRGALQNAANGASLTDARLTGSGTQAGNFGLLAAGTSSGNYSITLTGNGTGGNLLPGQSLAVVSNFDNVALQSLQLTGLSTVLARGSAAPAGPVNLGNFRVGIAPELQASLDVTNTTTGAGAERLGVGSVATSGNFSAVNALGTGLVAPGASSAAAVSVSTQAGVVGANNGSVTLQFVSDGRDFDPSFTAIASNQQTVDLLATGYLVAQPATPAVPVNVGNYRLVNGASSSFAVTNTNLAPAGLQEVLNATAGPGTAGVTFSGAINGLAPGASSNAMVIGFAAGGAAGLRNGSATLNLVSDGTGTSGLGLYDLAPATVQVTGTAFHLAGGTTAPTPVTVANQRVGDSARAALTVSNTGPAGLFTEALNASFAASSGAATTFGSGITDLAAASSDGLSLGVGVDSTSAGHKTGSVTLAYLSDGTGANGRSGLAAVSVGQQTIDVSGDVYRLATSSTASPNPVVLANQRVGGVLTQAITLSNTAATDGFSEGLNASISASGSATAGGSFSVLAAGASSGALFVGVDTSTAGAKGGTAAITLASDGTGTSGFGALGIGTQTFSVSGNVYRLAQANGATPNPVVFANQRVGDSGAVALSITNTAAADGFSEALNASITGNGNVLASGSFSLLAAGNTDNTSLLVSLDTSSAGARSGTATLTLTSDGTGSSGLGTFGLGTQTVTVNGGVYRLASASAASPSPVVLANQRVGGGLTQAITLANTAAADGFSEGLNGSIAASGAATAGGSFSLLAAGASSSALFVGVDTSTAGAKSGTATLTLASDGTGTSGFAALGIAGQQIGVSGDVYRLAVPVVNTAPITLVARVGDIAPSSPVNVANGGADAYTERLNASIASTPAGWAASGSVNGLATGQNSNALTLALNTTVAGSFAGSAGVALVSSGAGTTLAPDADLGTANVALTGRVYAPAVAQLPISSINFGTVRVGDVVPVRNVAVNNAAAGALADTLGASIGTLPGNGFAASGTVSGLIAGSSDTSTLNVALDTANAGVFSGAATVGFISRNPELADLALGSQDVLLQGQVNRLAEAGLAQSGGSGSLAGGGTHFTLSFGTLAQGAGSLLAFLDLSNTALAPADNLGGGFDLSGISVGSPFTLGGFGSVDIAAGSTLSGLTVSFASGAAGVFDEVIVLRGLSTNGSGPDLQLADVQLHLTGTVVAVPEPGTYLLMAGGLLMLARVTRRRALKRAA